MNGPDKALGAAGPKALDQQPIVPSFQSSDRKPTSLRQTYKEKGPQAFAKAVRQHKGLLLTDRTWRDAHQSLLATRLRSNDIETIAPATAIALKTAYSIEMWSGATFLLSTSE